MSKVSYTFEKIDRMIEAIKNYMAHTSISDFLIQQEMKSQQVQLGSQRKRTFAVVEELKIPVEIAPIRVVGLDRNKILQVFDFPLKVEILAPSRDPMQLLGNEWGDMRWIVDIKVEPKEEVHLDNDGNCFYMQVFIPVDNPDGVVVSWLDQIMINVKSHTQVAPEQCFYGPIPNYQWGTLFMNLYEAITWEFAKNNVFTFPAITSKRSSRSSSTTLSRRMQPEFTTIEMPVLGGLVDDAFVQYCGGPVVFSDFRRLIGQEPWYEMYGFMMANAKEYRGALSGQRTYRIAKKSVMNAFEVYKQDLALCRESEPDQLERSNVCNTMGLACDGDCPDGLCMMHHRDLYAFIGDKIKNNVSQACKWISDDPPVPVESACITKFNRHFNSQTIKIRNNTGMYDEYVVRLKFYS